MYKERAFVLQRNVDVSGVSGTGLVAHGMRHADGNVTVWWLGKHPTTTHHVDMVSVIDIHGHGGKTAIRWCEAHHGEWTIPWGEGRFIWVDDRLHVPMGDNGWIYQAPGTTTDRWNSKLWDHYEPRLQDGDHLCAVEGPDGSQCWASDGPAEDRITLLQLLAGASKVWVTRCLPETGGDPALVRISLKPLAPEKSVPDFSERWMPISRDR